MQFISESARQTKEFGERLAKRLKKGDIVCLSGELGSGKTTFVKGLARGLGIKEKEVKSPSFVLAREYQGKIPLYHLDFYRLKSSLELESFGFSEYLDGSGIVVIEWPEEAIDSLTFPLFKISFSILSKNKRKLTFQKVEKKL